MRARRQARVKPEYREKYPQLDPNSWYHIEPFFSRPPRPGEIVERVLSGDDQRIGRLQTEAGFAPVWSQHFDFRDEPRKPMQATGMSGQVLGVDVIRQEADS